MQAEYLRLFREGWADLQQPEVVWQIATIAGCLVLALLLARLIRRKAVTELDNQALRLGSGGVRRVAFPLTALALVFCARALLAPLMHVNLLNLAVPLLISLAVVRVVVYVLRLAFAPGSWLEASERLVATLVWGGVALYLTGLSAPLIDAMQGVKIPAGKTTLDLWMLTHGLAMVLATVLVALWVAGLVERRLNAASSLDSSVRVVIARTAKALLAMLAILLSLSAVGIDITALSVFGGALGVGLGLGLQKIASNYVAGFIILLDRSIRLGDVISLDASNTGVVTQITTRFTVVRAANGSEMLVPNEHLVSNIVHNQCFTDTRLRLTTQVQVTHATDLPAAMALLAALAAAHPRVIAEPPPSVQVLTLGENGIVLELGFWIGDPEQGTGNARSDINLEIWRAFAAAGIEFARPRRELRVAGQGEGPWH